MNRKEILRASRADVKRNFWIYLAAVTISLIIVGITGGILNIFQSLIRFLAAIRSGAFTSYQLGDLNSEFWSIMRVDSGVFTGGLGVIGVVITLFIANPLIVGMNKIFLNGMGKKPRLETIIEPFQNRYINTVSVLLFREILLNIILFAISVIYIIVTGIIVGIMILFENHAPGVMLVGGIICSVSALLATVGYCILVLNITYNFSMINYLIAEHPEYKFSEAYNISKKMVYGKKWDVFKTDFSVSVWIVIAEIIPIVLMCAGAILTMLSGEGIALVILGVFLIIPAICITLFFTVYRNSVWAHMYVELKGVCFNRYNNENVSSYEIPVYRKPISYVQEEQDTQNSYDDNNGDNDNNDNPA